MTKSIRLTNDIRIAMRTALVNQKFSNRKKELSVRRTKVAEMLYNKIVPKKQRDIAETLPEGWVKKCDQSVFRINVNDASIGRSYLQFIFQSENNLYEVNGITSYAHRDYYGLEIGIDDPIITDVKREQIIQIFKDLDKIEKEVSELEHELRTILWSTTSSKKLFEVWPEGEAFLPKEFQYVKTTDIAKIDTSKLNKILGGS